MIPTRRLYILAGALACLGVAAGLQSWLLPVWAGAAAALAIAAGTDLWVLRRGRLPTLRRDAPQSVAVGIWTTVTITVENPTGRDWKVEVFDHPPGEFPLRSLPFTTRVPAGRETSFDYGMKATERGARRFEPADLRVTGPLGLLKRHLERGDEQAFRVYPNFKAVARYALLALADKAGAMGIQQVRRRGSGMEFSHLREYREGDHSRQIDWKATARHQKLIAREYEDERNQQLVFMLDCGRRMRASDGDLSHFDRCLNASLLLSHVALDQGDSVAFATFGGEEMWIPRQKGPGGMQTILGRMYDLQPTTSPSDFSRAARRLTTHQRRRSLVVLLTNLYDQLTDELLDAIALLRERHLVLVASLRERVADELVERPAHDLADAVETAAGHAYRHRREQTHEALTSRGVMLLDTPPRELSVELVNRYIDIKRRGRL